MVGGIDVTDDQLTVVQAPQRGVAPHPDADGRRIIGRAAYAVDANGNRLRLGAATEVGRWRRIAVGIAHDGTRQRIDIVNGDVIAGDPDFAGGIAGVRLHDVGDVETELERVVVDIDDLVALRHRVNGDLAGNIGA